VLPTDHAERPSHLADKRAMSCLARRADVLVPEQVDALSTSTIDETIRALALPIVIKGAVGRGGQTTFIASSAAEARDALRRIEQRGTEAFAQRYIDGPTFLVGGVFHHGAPLRLYGGEKRVQFPSRTGPAAVLVSSRDDDLIRSATRVFQAVGLTGLASADFIRDRDGRFHFLELNPRPWGSIAVARDAGVDLFGALAALWQGAIPTPDVEFREFVRSPIVPLALASPAAWLSGDAWRALGAASQAITSGAVPPRLAVHLARRALRVARNW
jgi:biotin carboxylase